MQIVRPHDAQGLVISWLTSTFELLGYSVPVDSRAPQTLPKAFVRVVRTGGFDELVTDDATLEVESFVKGTDDAAAFALAADVRGLIVAMDGETVDGVFVRSAESASGPANLPDPTFPLHQRVRQLFAVSLKMRVTDL